MNKNLIILLIVILALGVGYFFGFDIGFERAVNDNDVPSAAVDSFEGCVAAGNPVMESYPRRCIHNGQSFTEFIGNELEKLDLIRLSAPRPNQEIASPLSLGGEARGFWFFEADFPIILTDWDGRIIAQHFATAQGDWMTEEFVPFSSTLEFESPYKPGDPDFMRRGFLILQKDNPSGLPEHDDALEIPVLFSQ